MENSTKKTIKNFDEERVMHSKSGNTEVMIYDKIDEVIEEHFKLLLLLVSNWVTNINER